MSIYIAFQPAKTACIPTPCLQVQPCSNTVHMAWFAVIQSMIPKFLIACLSLAELTVVVHAPASCQSYAAQRKILHNPSNKLSALASEARIMQCETFGAALFNVLTPSCHVCLLTSELACGLLHSCHTSHLVSSLMLCLSHAGGCSTRKLLER